MCLGAQLQRKGLTCETINSVPQLKSGRAIELLTSMHLACGVLCEKAARHFNCGD